MKQKTKSERELMKAQKLAISGNIEDAQPIVEGLYLAGHVGSAVTLAEIYAFQGRWKDSFDCAFLYLLNIKPSDTTRPMNLYSECVALIAACCMEEATLVKDVLSLAAQAETALIASLDSNPSLDEDFKSSPGLAELSFERKEEVRRQVRASAFGYYKNMLDRLPQFVSSGDYESVFYKFDIRSSNPQLIPDKEVILSKSQISYLFSMCKGDGKLLVELLARYGYGPWLLEEHLRNIAKCFINDGHTTQAWEAITALATNWAPVMTNSSVLPSILVTDPTIREFLKGERMAEVMLMPKGKKWLA